jgi:hypothetical protein
MFFIRERLPTPFLPPLVSSLARQSKSSCVLFSSLLLAPTLLRATDAQTAGGEKVAEPLPAEIVQAWEKAGVACSRDHLHWLESMPHV